MLEKIILVAIGMLIGFVLVAMLGANEKDEVAADREAYAVGFRIGYEIGYKEGMADQDLNMKV